MVIDAKEMFAERTAKLMFSLTREEMEVRLEQFPEEHIKLVVRIARNMVELAKL